MNDNLKLWKSVETTDPAHTQKARVSGQNRTTVKAIYQKERATEIFGVQGQSWGIVVGSEDYSRTHLQDGEIMLQYLAVLYYDYNGSRGELPIAAAIMEASTVKRGTPDQYLRIDHEAIKKVRTDAMTKGLSDLGFNADIFKGHYDSQGYSDYAMDKVSEERDEKLAQEAIKEAEEYKVWKDKELSYYSSLNTVRAVTTAHTEHVRRANKVGDHGGIKQFTEAKDARLKELTEAKNNG